MQAKFPVKLSLHIPLADDNHLWPLYILSRSLTFRTSMYQSLFFGARQRFVGIKTSPTSHIPNYLRSMGILWFVFLSGGHRAQPITAYCGVLNHQTVIAAERRTGCTCLTYALSPAVAHIWLFLFNPIRV